MPTTSQPTRDDRSRRAAALPPEERRAMIVAATLPLLMESGPMVTTRQIAEAAGIAEGTIFRVFDDKDALIAAALERALDTAAVEKAMSAIDRTQPFEAQLVEAAAILQRRVTDLFRLLSKVGPRVQEKPARPLPDTEALIEIFAAADPAVGLPPARAARLLHALCLSLSHPVLVAEPAPPEEIVAVLLHGIGSGATPC